MTVTLLTGDCRDVLAGMASGSVHMVCTSPPYYGLRDYGTALWDGGDAACDHVAPPDGGRGKSTMNSGEWHERWIAKLDRNNQYRDTCGKCGAIRIDRQIGLEPTPDAYLATMVAVFREVRRVLRRDGTCWVNVGDSYNANQGSGFNGNAGKPTASPRAFTGLAAKQLLLMPARLALALQADGWWVRSDIIWHKPNPMPESCTDRCVSAHEHVFMLTKSARYFFDSDAIRESATADNREVFRGAGSYVNGNSRDNASVIAAYGKGHVDGVGTRSCRNVWTIATHAYPQAHFATYPPELAERCIRAGTSERGCCAACGKPWGRVTDKTFVPQGDVSLERGVRCALDQKPMDATSGWEGSRRGTISTTTTGWQPGCKCEAADPVPCAVLDPFAGAGTTLLVADRLQRDAIGIELNEHYNTMARTRIDNDAGMFVDYGDAPVPEPPEDARMGDLFAWAAD